MLQEENPSRDFYLVFESKKPFRIDVTGGEG